LAGLRGRPPDVAGANQALGGIDERQERPFGGSAGSRKPKAKRRGHPINLADVDRVVASWFGTGLLLGRWRGSDRGSGTVAAAFALPPALALGLLGWEAQLAAALIATAASLWSTRRFAADDADPGWVVIDEVAGTFLAVIGLHSWAVVTAFVVFRMADITKKFPGVAAAERLGGAAGITADDQVAALWALAAGWLVQAVF